MAASAALLCLTGCATLFNRGRDWVQIYSPSGIRRVREQDRVLPLRLNRDRTAYEVQLAPSGPHVLSIETGHATHSVVTTRSVGAGWVVLDVLCHPLICVLVDALTGAWTGFDPIYLLDPPTLSRSTAALHSPVVPPRGDSTAATNLVAPWERR